MQNLQLCHNQKHYRTKHKQLFIQDLFTNHEETPVRNSYDEAPRPAPHPHCREGTGPTEGAARPERAEPSTMLSEKESRYFSFRRVSCKT